MGVLRNDFSQNRRLQPPVKRGGSISADTARELAENPSLPIMHRKPAVFKPLTPESTAKRQSNTNRPLIIYDSAPLEQVLESISFRRKPRGNKEGAGAKLTL